MRKGTMHCETSMKVNKGITQKKNSFRKNTKQNKGKTVIEELRKAKHTIGKLLTYAKK